MLGGQQTAGEGGKLCCERERSASMSTPYLFFATLVC